MDVQRFVDWCENAGSAERAGAAQLLVDAFVGGDVPIAERADAELLLSLLTEDPSPKVRTILAKGFAATRTTPRAVLLALANDIDPIACLVVERSPLFRDDDLIELALTRSALVAAAIAARPLLSLKVSAALAEVADPAVCARLLANEGAALAVITYHRLVAIHGDSAAVREALLRRSDLPASARQSVLMKTGTALAQLPLFVNLVGEPNAERQTMEACERATAQLGSGLGEGEATALVEHLRASGQLTAALLVRIVCGGNIDFFATALARLSMRSEEGVQAVVAGGRRSAMQSLLHRAGLPAASHRLFIAAIDLWRDIDAGCITLSETDVPSALMGRLSRESTMASNGEGFDPLMRFLHRLAGDGLRDAGRDRLHRLAA